MNILLFGISNVGKTTIGGILARKLEYTFFDIDEEVKNRYHTTLEHFVNTVWPYERDKIRGEIIGSILSFQKDTVVAVTPMYYTRWFSKYLDREDVMAIELQDSPENVFGRLVFSDENDRVYKDDEYRDAHKAYYMRDIKKDITYYKKPFMKVKNKFSIDGASPEEAADQLIERYSLSPALERMGRNLITNHE